MGPDLKLTRRDLLRQGTAAAAAACAPPLNGQARRPNIVFLLADDLGWGDLGCYGNPYIRTPNLDRLARQGVLFTNFYVNAPVCSPTRAAFLTGQYPARHRIHTAIAGPEENAARNVANWLDPDVPNLARLLRQSAYATGHFGKWHLGRGKGAPLPAEYGFDTVRAVNSNEPAWVEQPGFRAKSSALIVDETIAFIEKNRNRPFYANVWSLVPHATLDPTEEQMEPYRRFQPGGAPHKSARQIYYASVTDLDTEIGRLLKRLDELGLAGNTLVLFSSDNGPEDIHVVNAGHSGVGSAGPFRGRKRSLYEGGIRTPLLARWPAAAPAGTVDSTSVVSGVDFLPTICKLAGAEVPASHPPDGEDRGAVLSGAPAPRRKPLFWEWRFRITGHVMHRSPMLAMRDGDWKLLMNPDRGRVELYNIARDPRERDNLARAEAQIAGRMAERLLAWRTSLPAGPVDPDAGRDEYPWPGDARNTRARPGRFE